MIRAFVSSTYVDLKEHRAYVIGRLTAAGKTATAIVQRVPAWISQSARSPSYQSSSLLRQHWPYAKFWIFHDLLAAILLTTVQTDLINSVP